MNYKQIKTLSKLLSFVFQSGIPTATEGTIRITDNDVELDINGGFRRLCIYFTGNIFIYNNLPDGYYINMTDSLIVINNLLLKNLKNDNILFSYDGNLDISRAYIMTLGGKRINIKIEDIDRLELVHNSKTNVEDDSLLLLEEIIAPDNIAIKSGIDDDSIKGLYAHKPLADGYTGYYNYHPRENIYMTGKTLTNQSKPIGKSASSFRTNKNKLNLTRVLNKTLKRGAVSDTRAIAKPIKTKIAPTKKKEIKTTKGGKY